MEGSYNVFVAIESGTDFEDFMDHTANTKYVDEWDYWYGEEFGMGEDVLFYQLKVPNRKDAGLIAKSIYVTGRIGIRKGKLYRVSVGAPGADIHRFVERCTA